MTEDIVDKRGGRGEYREKRKGEIKG